MTRLKWKLFGLFATIGMIITLVAIGLANVFESSASWIILAHVSGWYGHAFNTSKSFVARVCYPSAVSGGALILSGYFLYLQIENYYNCYSCGGVIGFPMFLIPAAITAALAIFFFINVRKIEEPEATPPES